MAMRRTLIILKPDAVARRLVGRLISRFEDKGLSIVGLKLMKIPLSLARRQYAEHKGKPFYQGLLKFMTSGPVVLMVVEGKDAVRICRTMLGATFGSDAEPGTLRGDFGISNRFNLVHGSDSAASARREIGLFFKPSELVKPGREDLRWIYDLSGKDPL